MSARDVAFTLMALGHVAGCRGKTATEILAEAVGELVRLNTEIAAKSDAYRDNIATWMTKYGDKAAECHEYRLALEEILHHLCLPCDKRDDGVLEHIATTALEYKEAK